MLLKTVLVLLACIGKPFNTNNNFEFFFSYFVFLLLFKATAKCDDVTSTFPRMVGGTATVIFFYHFLRYCWLKIALVLHKVTWDSP